MPGDPGVTVVTTSCAFYLCTRDCGCIGHPAFPTPFVGREIPAQLGRITPRECGGVSYRHCEPTGRANARPMTGSAKQSILSSRLHGLLRRFAPRNDAIGCLKIESGS